MKHKQNALLTKFKNYLSRDIFGKSSQFNKAVLGLVFAMGFAGVSLNVEAANSSIVKVNGGTTVVTNGNVHNIYADKVSLDSAVAINHFKDFRLSANEIANLHFKSVLGINEANTLLNFVDSKIDIAGTVNAIKGGQIGGNLYFISSQGMVVGRTGVINAGSLNVITPVQKDYDKLAKEGNLFNGKSMLNKITKQEFAINPQGTIVIQGKVNTTDGINVKANTIEMYGESNNKAVLKTGIVDFTDLVNVTDANGNVVVDANLGKDLKATLAGNGDIILEAVESNARITMGQGVEIASAGDVKGNAENVSLASDIKASKNVEFTSANAIVNNGVLEADEKVKLTAGTTLDNNGKVYADKDIALKAETDLHNNGIVSAANDVELTAGGNVDNNRTVDAGNNITIIAGKNVNNNGTLTAGKDINITADVDYINNSIIDAGNDIAIKANNSMVCNGMWTAGNDMILAAEKDLTINADLFVEGNIYISAESIRVYADISAEEDANLLAGKELLNDRTIEAGNNAVLSSGGTMENNGAITASGNISLAAEEKLTNNGDLTANGSVALTSEGSLNNAGSIKADKDVTLDAGDSLTNNGAVDGKGEVALKANNGLVNNAKLNSGNGLSMTSILGYIINRGAVISSKNITISAKKDVSIIADVTANDSVALVSTFGNVNTGDTMQSVSVMSLNDSVEVKAYESVALYNVAAKNDVSMLSSFGDVSVNDVSSQNGNVEVKAQKNISFSQISSKAKVSMASSSGNITGKKLDAPANELLSSTGQVIIDFIFGENEKEPNNPPYIDHDYEIKRQQDEARIISAMYNKDTDKEKFGEMNLVYYNRYDLYELEPLQPPTVTEDGTTIIAGNNALQMSVAEAAEKKEGQKTEN